MVVVLVILILAYNVVYYCLEASVTYFTISMCEEESFLFQTEFDKNLAA